MSPVAAPPVSSIAPASALNPLEHGDPDLGHGEARGLRGQRGPALLRVVGRRRGLRELARGGPEGRERGAKLPLVAAAAVALEPRELAVEGVEVAHGQGRAEGREALEEVGAVDLGRESFEEGKERVEVEGRRG